METITITTELTTLVKSSGLEETKQNEISESLGLFFAKAKEWDQTIASIVITRPDEIEKMKMAKEGRLIRRRMRLDAEEVVKGKRDVVKSRMANDKLEDTLWLKAGQMMEATFKNLETKLEEKEKFAERFEADRKAKLRTERIAEITPFAEFIPIETVDFGSMSEEDYSKMLIFGKQQLQNKFDAIEKEKEAARLKALEDERIRVENERLKKEAEEKEKEIQAERVRVEKEKVEAQAKADAERKALEEKAAKEKAEADAKLKAEKERADKLAAEAKAKADAEEKRIADEKAKAIADQKAKELADKKAKAAPDKVKLLAFAKQIDELQLPELASPEAGEIGKNIRVLLSKVSTYIREKSETI